MSQVRKISFIFVLFAFTNVFANDMYKVKAKNGVNVRKDVLFQTQSKIQDIINYDSVLEKLDEVSFDKNNKWGKFIYKKNGIEKIGWIKMRYLRKVSN